MVAMGAAAMADWIASNSAVLDTRFRSALRRMREAGRLQAYERPADTNLEIAAIMKRSEDAPAILFTAVKGHAIPVLGNFLSSRANCEAAFGLGFAAIRDLIGRALGAPQQPELVRHAPAQQHIIREGIDLGRLLPALHHTPADAGRFITAGVVIVRDPETGVVNASYHRLQLIGAAEVAIKLSTMDGICGSRSSARSGSANRCRSRSASAPMWRCNTPPPPWARKCPRAPTRSR